MFGVHFASILTEFHAVWRGVLFWCVCAAGGWCGGGAGVGGLAGVIEGGTGGGLGYFYVRQGKPRCGGRLVGLGVSVW